MSEQAQENQQPVTKGPNKTPKSLWRNKRGATDFQTWKKQLDAYIDKVNPKLKHKGGRR